MAAVLRIRNPETGEFEEIKTLVGPEGPEGPQGPQGPKGDSSPLSNNEPLALGVASPGTATNASREDHIHPMPTAADIGALYLPSGEETPGEAPVVNAGTLGGKAPEYYIQPRNLLDNSDFRNPVNQRGQTSYSGNIYTIDRWGLWWDGIEEGTLSITEKDSITVTKSLYQNIIGDTNKTYTFAVMLETGLRLICGKPKESVTDGVLLLIESNGMIQPSIINGGKMYWAALYEGAYTVDTLPPYVPKGYAAELAECQRYYRHFINNAFLGTAIVSGDSTLIQGFIPLDTPMRIQNPSIIGTLAFYESTQNQALGTPVSFVQQGNGIRCNWNLTTTLTAKSVGFINALGDVGISADL